MGIKLVNMLGNLKTLGASLKPKISNYQPFQEVKCNEVGHNKSPQNKRGKSRIFKMITIIVNKIY